MLLLLPLLRSRKEAVLLDGRCCSVPHTAPIQMIFSTHYFFIIVANLDDEALRKKKKRSLATIVSTSIESRRFYMDDEMKSSFTYNICIHIMYEQAHKQTRNKVIYMKQILNSVY